MDGESGELTKGEDVVGAGKTSQRWRDRDEVDGEKQTVDSGEGYWPGVELMLAGATRQPLHTHTLSRDPAVISGRSMGFVVVRTNSSPCAPSVSI